MTARRVAVTGLGVLSPIGNDPKTFFASLMAGKSGIKRLEMDFVDQLDCKIAAYINDFDPLDHFVKIKAATMDRVTQLSRAQILLFARHALHHPLRLVKLSDKLDMAIRT